MQVFAAEILRELGIETFSRNLNYAHYSRIAVHDGNRHQLLNGSGCGDILAFFGLDGFKDAGVFDTRKVIEDLGLLTEGSVRSDRFAGERNRTGGAQVLRKNEA